ncbi:hypothetical protein LTR15_000129 [Elasticomyces elasticus]|nr:hypothetical protein LTR15_000129 [Elasticomyces elasticus]
MDRSSAVQRFVRLVEIRRDGDTDIQSHITKDTRPLPPSRRTYGPWTFVGLWMVTGSFNVNGWATGSSVISLGLNVWQAILAIIIGNAILGLCCVLFGAPGAKWHIAFPQWMRQIFGIRGYMVPMAVRIFLSFVWIATNCWYGGQCLKVFLLCIWPSFANLKTELANGTMMTSDFVAFLLFVLSCLPLMWFSPERYKIPFLIGSTTVATTMVVLLIWAVVRADGGGALLADTSAAAGIPPAKGAKLGWAFVSATVAIIGSSATHMFSQSDYTRYARKPGDQILAQAIMVPLGGIGVATIGILCTSCAYTLYPQLEKLPWNPYNFLNAVRMYEDNQGARAGVAFASLAFVMSQWGIVVAANAVVGGIDLAAVWPRWITLRRGGYLTILGAFIMQPWSLLNGASDFLTVVGSFSVFLGPFMGIFFVDYYILRKRTIKLTELYEESPKSLYWYVGGFNWRAVIAWPAGFWFLLPGLAQRATDPGAVWAGWTRLYNLAWFLGFSVAGLTYLLLALISPMRELCAVDDDDYFGTFDDRVLSGKEPSEDGSPTELQSTVDAKGAFRQQVTADGSV